MPVPKGVNNKNKLEKYFPASLKKKYKKQLKGLTIGQVKEIHKALKAQEKYAKTHRSPGDPPPICYCWTN